MANLLDEKTGPVNDAGRDINVIDKQLPVKTGFGSVLFQIAIWAVLPIVGIAVGVLLPFPDNVFIIMGGVVGGLICGLVWQYMKTKAHNYFQQLEQKIQAEASNIDNYLEQRVVILTNLAGLVAKAIDLDKDVMTRVAALRSGVNPKAEDLPALSGRIEAVSRGLNLQVEAYPELKAHQSIADAIQQNNYLQREVTAARSVYNDRVYQWNREIYNWPTKMIVAAREGYTSRIPFTTTMEIKQEARKNFF